MFFHDFSHNMEYYILKGFLLVLLIQYCTSEGPSASIHSSTVVSYQDGQALTQEPALPAAEVVQVVSPPSLKEVQQAVQEASEQVEGRGAEEVLKELLERVVEAALGQVEGGNEAKGDVTTVQEVVEDILGAEISQSETDTEAEVLEPMVEDKNVGIKGRDTGVEEKQGVEEAAVFEVVGKEGKEVVKGEDETAAESAEKTTADVETGVHEAESVEVINESPESEFSQEDVEGAVAALEETGGDLEEAREDINKEQVVISEENGAIEPEIQGEEETPAVVEVAVGGQSEQGTVEESEVILGVAVVEEMWQDLGKEEALGGEILVAQVEGEVIALPSDNSELETIQTVEEAPVEQEDETNLVIDTGVPIVENEQDPIVEEGTAEEVGTKVTEVEGTTGDERNGESVIMEESVALANQEDDQRAGEAEQAALETSHLAEKEAQEVLVIGPEPEAEASIEQSSENQAPTPNPSVAELETGENTLDDANSNHGNEILTPTDDLLPYEPAVAQPTLDEQPQAEGEEPGEVNELVEDTAETPEANELDLEAWKIGAISAAVFLVLETVVIIIYILKRRNKNSTAAIQRACEEGCVEPEAATGGDCSDDTLPAGNGDTQQISVLDPSDVASTLAKTKEQQEDHAIALSDLPPRSTEESANTGPGPDSSQDLRTSIL